MMLNGPTAAAMNHPTAATASSLLLSNTAAAAAANTPGGIVMQRPAVMLPSAAGTPGGYLLAGGGAAALLPQYVVGYPQQTGTSPELATAYGSASPYGVTVPPAAAAVYGLLYIRCHRLLFKLKLKLKTNL